MWPSKNLKNKRTISLQNQEICVCRHLKTLWMINSSEDTRRTGHHILPFALGAGIVEKSLALWWRWLWWWFLMMIYHDLPFFCGIHNDVTCFLYMVGVMIAHESLRSEALTAIPGHRLAKNQCESVHDVMDWISLNSIGEFWFAAKNRPKSAQHSYKLLERTTLPLSPFNRWHNSKFKT